MQSFKMHAFLKTISYYVSKKLPVDCRRRQIQEFQTGEGDGEGQEERQTDKQRSKGFTVAPAVLQPSREGVTHGDRNDERIPM